MGADAPCWTVVRLQASADRPLSEECVLLDGICSLNFKLKNKIAKQTRLPEFKTKHLKTWAVGPTVPENPFGAS